MRRFKFVNPRIEELEAKCHLLSTLVDKYTGENTVLKEQLAQVQYERSQLLERIFDLTGINRREVHIGMETPKVAINRSQSWPKVKEELEVKARKEYWEKKRRDEEAKGSKERIENLEKEVGVSDASKISEAI